MKYLLLLLFILPVIVSAQKYNRCEITKYDVNTGRIVQGFPYAPCLTGKKDTLLGVVRFQVRTCIGEGMTNPPSYNYKYTFRTIDTLPFFFETGYSAWDTARIWGGTASTDAHFMQLDEHGRIVSIDGVVIWSDKPDTLYNQGGKVLLRLPVINADASYLFCYKREVIPMNKKELDSTFNLVRDWYQNTFQNEGVQTPKGWFTVYYKETGYTFTKYGHGASTVYSRGCHFTPGELKLLLAAISHELKIDFVNN